MSNRKEFLEQTIRKILKEELDTLVEGIDVDYNTRTVSFNSNHENNVDTSIAVNPTYNGINGINVISIFKRKRNDENTDGNPLIYALKGKNDWHFKNPESDISNLLKQFIRISEKIRPEYDTIITVPSQNVLNTNILHRLNKIIKCKYTISDYLYKTMSEDVFENYIDWSAIYKDFGDRKGDSIQKELGKSFYKMEEENHGYFSYRFIKDSNLRKYITKTMYSNDNEIIEYAPYVNGKDILILDDTISSGSSISEATKLIQETFIPNTITVITLFSKV